jgi:hypothetical protein
MLIALLVPLCLAILFFTYFLARAAIAARAAPKLEAIALGAVVSFFDTLGIGSFAPAQLSWKGSDSVQRRFRD